MEGTTPMITTIKYHASNCDDDSGPEEDRPEDQNLRKLREFEGRV